MPHPVLFALTLPDPDTRADWRMGASPTMAALGVIERRVSAPPPAPPARLTPSEERLRAGRDRKETMDLETPYQQKQLSKLWENEAKAPDLIVASQKPQGWPSRKETAAACKVAAFKDWLAETRLSGDAELVQRAWAQSAAYQKWLTLHKQEPEPFAASSPMGLATHFTNCGDDTYYYAQFNSRVYEWRHDWTSKGPCWHPLNASYKLSNFTPLDARRPA